LVRKRREVRAALPHGARRRQASHAIGTTRRGAALGLQPAGAGPGEAAAAPVPVANAWSGS